MSKNLITSLRQDLEDKAHVRTEVFETINMRPGSKIAAMIELLAELRGVPVFSMLTDALSEKLAQHAASDLRHAPAILDAATAYIATHGDPSEHSALGLLLVHSILNIEPIT